MIYQSFQSRGRKIVHNIVQTSKVEKNKPSVQKIRELLEVSQVSSMDGIQNLFNETMAEFMEDVLDAELSEEQG